MYIVPADINSAHMLEPSNMLDSINFLLAEHCNGADIHTALRNAIWHNSVFQTPEVTVKGPCAILTHWQGMDSTDNYQKHMSDPVTRQQLEQNNWVDTVINYHVNSSGFRSSVEYDLVQEPCIVALGCSFTFGTGLHEHQTWPSVLGERLGVRVINLGMPGHSLDLNSLWLTLSEAAIVNPLAVCVMEPPNGRVSWLALKSAGPDVYTTQLRQQCGDNLQIISNLLLNSLTNSYKNYHTIKAWADRKGVPMLWNRNLLNPYVNSLARDLSHNGAEWHQHKANDFYSHLKNT
jgi:hypothetical protein